MSKRYQMLIMANADNNNNKFYELKLEDDDSVVARYGRVGVQGVTEHKGHGEATFDKVAKAKKAKGYREVNILTTENVSKPISGNVVELAKRDIIRNNPVLEKLIEKLAKINRHQLLAASGGNIDIVDGQVKTPLGLVTLDSVLDAKKKLNELNKFVLNQDLNRDYVTCLEDYLTLVPQKVGHKRGWHTNFFTEFTTFQNQNDLLEQIEQSIKSYQPPAPSADNNPVEKLFGYNLTLLEDVRIFDRINKFYSSNINSRHVTRGYKLKKVYTLINPEKENRYKMYETKLGNVKQLWHGTRPSNVLSILKGGLVIPPTNNTNFTISGRMFGNGCYFSDQSTKALNYATPYWSGGQRESDELYMFYASVAMGKEYTPSGPTQYLPKGYDSIFAKANISGVMNNEMVAPLVDQFRLDYLCEFLE